MKFPLISANLGYYRDEMCSRCRVGQCARCLLYSYAEPNRSWPCSCDKTDHLPCGPMSIPQ